MTDFTKEELQYLFRTFMLTNSDDFEHRLEAKLQSMIDNYDKKQLAWDIIDKSNKNRGTGA